MTTSQKLFTPDFIFRASDFSNATVSFAFSKAGYGIEDAYNFYMHADSTDGKSDGEVSQGELVTALEKDAGMSQPQKNAIYEYYMQQNGWKTGYDAALKNAKKSGKKYGVA